MQGHGGQYYGYSYNEEKGNIKTGKKRRENITQQFEKVPSQTANSFAGVASRNLMTGGQGFPQRQLDVKTLLHKPDPGSTLYNPDFALYDKFEREQKLVRKENIQEKHRVEALKREQVRWDYYDKQDKNSQQKLEYHAKVIKDGKKNSNGMPFDPITLQYQNSQEGQKLKVRDDEAKVRGYVRAQNLDTRANCGYNVLTGENRTQVETLVPRQLKSKYEEKLEKKNQFYAQTKISDLKKE